MTWNFKITKYKLSFIICFFLRLIAPRGRRQNFLKHRPMLLIDFGLLLRIDELGPKQELVRVKNLRLDVIGAAVVEVVDLVELTEPLAVSG